jgi:hypothetical protein
VLQGFLYVRQNNPSRQILEKGFALLEDAKYSLCFSSGTSAISAVVQLLNTGEHIVSSEVIVGSTYHYFDRVRLFVQPTNKYIPVTGRDRLQGCETSRFPHFLDNRLTNGGKTVSLTRRQPFTPRNIPGTHFCWRLSRSQGHGAAGRIK